jgi:pyruvate decarboxylase
MTETKRIPLAAFLFQRIKQLGVEHILGVPGDFNLQLLDYIYKIPDLKWVGCCNELNAAYAADGYGRVKGPTADPNQPAAPVPGVLITTYGVGELSALNGASGAHAENVPMLHIVGTTGRAIQQEHLLIHHVPPSMDLSPADHTRYMDTSKPFACAHEFLTDPLKAPYQIDRVITEVCKQSRPGYLYIPVDMVHKGIPEQLLSAPLDVELVNHDSTLENSIVSEMLSAVYDAKSPVILADVVADRFNCKHILKRLAEKTKFWSFTTPMGKGLIDETDAYFVGCYNGKLSLPGVAEAVHASDLVINVGPLLSDSNTGGFTREVKNENAIMLHPLYCSVKGKVYEGIQFVPVLQKLVEQLDVTKLPTFDLASKPQTAPLDDPHTTHISQECLVASLSKFVRPDDTLVVESGTFQFAAPDMKFKENINFITQIFYSSIGFALPAALGAAIARREQKHGRVVLVEGDGSAQMTIQELGTMVRQRLPITIFLLNNDGYSIERAIWGPEQKYNDICPDWKWTQLLSVFGGTDETVANYTVRTREELDGLLANKEFTENSTKVQLVEVILDAFDYPWILKAQVKGMTKFNVDKAMEYAMARNE